MDLLPPPTTCETATAQGLSVASWAPRHGTPSLHPPPNRLPFVKLPWDASERLFQFSFPSQGPLQVPRHEQQRCSQVVVRQGRGCFFFSSG